MIFSDIKIEDYCVFMSSEIPQYLLELERETNLSTTMPQMLSGRLQGRFLSLISRMVKPDTILELGTFTGYSALCLAEGMKKDGKLISIELDEEFKPLIDKYISLSPFAENIKIIYGDALDLMSNLDIGFDLVFIDAYKQDYISYYEKSLLLLNDNGIIITDNVLWSGQVINEPYDKTAWALNEFNEYVRNDSRTEQIMLPVRDGISLIVKK
ncbi:MAG: O-methyltransferase [Deltaproteobacteria bacterium]